MSTKRDGTKTGTPARSGRARQRRGGARPTPRAAGQTLAAFERAARKWTAGDRAAVVTIGITERGPIVVGMVNSAGSHVATVPTLADLLAALTGANEAGDLLDRAEEMGRTLRRAPGDDGEGWQ